jgi:hypothetical protein
MVTPLPLARRAMTVIRRRAPARRVRTTYKQLTDAKYAGLTKGVFHSIGKAFQS